MELEPSLGISKKHQRNEDLDLEQKTEGKEWMECTGLR